MANKRICAPIRAARAAVEQESRLSEEQLMVLKKVQRQRIECVLTLPVSEELTFTR
jgi:hypothetical protein